MESKLCASRALLLFLCFHFEHTERNISYRNTRYARQKRSVKFRPLSCEQVCAKRFHLCKFAYSVSHSRAQLFFIIYFFRVESGFNEAAKQIHTEEDEIEQNWKRMIFAIFKYFYRPQNTFNFFDSPNLANTHKLNKFNNIHHYLLQILFAVRTRERERAQNEEETERESVRAERK